MLALVLNIALLPLIILVNGEWSYAEKERWGDHFPLCRDGNTQSPVDVRYDDSFKVDNLSKLNILQDENSGGKMVLTNNGHTLQVNIKSNIHLSGAGLGNKFRAAQLHFHWGRVNRHGSEHYRDSKQYAMEMHIVCFDSSKYSTLASALPHANAIAVVSVLFKITRKPNENFNEIIENISHVKEQNTATPIKTLKISKLMHANRSKFYRYPGSLTTPGCHQSVIWTVMESVNHISQAQINIFRSAKHSGHTISGNFRNPQNLYGRTITRSFNRKN